MLFHELTVFLKDKCLIKELITPGKSLGYTDIYLDFLSDSEKTRSFYKSADINEVAHGLDQINYDRDKIASILEKQNNIFGCGQPTLDNISKLKNKNSLCVFSGQQAGLFGGPMLVIFKAIGIIKAAKEYSQQLGRPIIPVFWIAGDDHDFEEINHTYVLDNDGKPVRISYDKFPEQEWPASEIRFTDAETLEHVKENLLEGLGETDFSVDLMNLINCTYRLDDTLVVSFGKFMMSLMGQFGLVLFNPGDAEVKSLAVPLFKAIIEKQDRLHDLFIDTNREIQKRGYHLQVEKKDNASHLFFNLDGRNPVMRLDGRYITGDKEVSLAELNADIEKCPKCFSPDVIMRPVLQSYLFPVLSQKGGPAEIAYLAQINPIFEIFGLVPPVYRSRPTATLVEKRFEKMMGDYEIKFEELTGDIEQVINRVLGETFPKDIEYKFEQLRESVEEHFRQFSENTLKFDPSLEKFAHQIFGKIDFNLKAFEGKVFSAHKKKSGETRERIYRLGHALFTNQALHERSLNITYFLSKYGFDLINFVYERLDSEEKAHQLIYLSEYGK